MILNYATSNEYKVFMASQFLKPYGIKVVQRKIKNCIEIQDDNVENVAKFSAEYACKILQEPVLKNDGGLYIPALNGFPAAYTHFVEDSLGEDGILKLLENIENRRAYWIEALAFAQPNKATVIFKCKTEGTIARSKLVKNGWGFDRIFIPTGNDIPWSNYDDTTRGLMWDRSGYDKLANYLLANIN